MPSRPWLITLAVIGVLNSAISAAYYLRVVGVMFFRVPLAAPPIHPRSKGARTVAVVCAVLTVVLIGLYPGLWMGWANESSPAMPSIAPRPAVVENPQQTAGGDGTMETGQSGGQARPLSGCTVLNADP